MKATPIMATTARPQAGDVCGVRHSRWLAPTKSTNCRLKRRTATPTTIDPALKITSMGDAYPSNPGIAVRARTSTQSVEHSQTHHRSRHSDWRYRRGNSDDKYDDPGNNRKRTHDEAGCAPGSLRPRIRGQEAGCNERETDLYQSYDDQANSKAPHAGRLPSAVATKRAQVAG